MKMKEPRTRAGKSLLGSQIQTVEAILAVEDEAEAQARPAGASELRAALELLDPIIRHVESWPPAGDSFLDDLRTIRAALASDAGSVGALDGYDAGKGAALIDGWWAERHLAIAGRPEGDPVAVQAFMEMQERAARILDAGIINADAGSLDAERQGEQ